MKRLDLQPHGHCNRTARHEASGAGGSRVRAGVMLAALALLFAASGCGGHDIVLARVGQRVITREDFETAAVVNAAQYQDVPERARARLLDDLVKRELLLSVADARGLSHNAMTEKYRRNITDQVLASSLTMQLTPRTVPVTESEIEEFYEWTRISAHLQVMYSPDRAMMDAGLARLRAGQPFGEVAQQVTPAGLLPPGGDLGEVTVGTMVDPLDDFARTAPVGQVVGPVAGGGEGWFVARVLSRRTMPAKAPLEVLRGQLTQLIRQRKMRMIAARAYFSLRDQYRIVLEPGGPEALYSRLNGGAFEPNGAAPRPPDTNAVLARYTDAAGHTLTYRLGDAVADAQTPDREHPDASGTPALRLWIGQQVVQRVLLLEAHRRGLDRDPQVIRRINANVENGLLETVYTDVVAQAVSVTPDDVQRAYQAQGSQFPRLQAAHIQSITLPDSAAALELTRHGGHAPSLLEAAKMMGLGGDVTDQRVTFPSHDPTWQAVEPQVLMMTRGEWAGPGRVPGGWRVFEVIEKETQPQALDQLSEAERRGVEQLALEMKRDQRLTFVTDSLRRVTHPFEVHGDELARIPWPPISMN
jgi:parvulin-like peptidyl-prolyl isomerase